MDDRKPEICLRDDDIKRYAGKAVTAFQIGDEVTLTLTCRVKGVESTERVPYDSPVAVGAEGGKQPKKPEPKIENRLELEVVGGERDGEDEMDEYLKKDVGE